MRIRFLKSAFSGILFIIVILMTIAMGAMVYSSMSAASSNISASRKAITRQHEFHYLDGLGAEFIAHMDTALLNAQRLTNEYIESESYNRLTHPDFTLDKQTFIREGSNDAAFLEQVSEMLFFAYADRELDKLRDIYHGVVITVIRDEEHGFESVRSLFTDITLTHPENKGLHLSITASVGSYNTFRIEQSLGNNEATRFRITAWRLWESSISIEED